MQLSLDTTQLSPLLSIVQRITSKRSTLPILSHVLLTAEENRLTFSATDLETGIRLTCPAKVKEPGTVTIDAQKFYQLTKDLSATEITLKSGENYTELKSGKSRFKLPGLDPAEFPFIFSQQEAEPLASLTFPARAFCDAIDRTAFATDTDSSQRSGLCLSQSGTTAALIGTDGLRLAYAPIAPASEKWEEVLFPKAGLLSARKLLEKQSGDITVTVHASLAVISFPDAALGIRLVEGSFPDYRQIVKKSHLYKVSVDREALASALRRLLALTTERTRGIAFIFKDKALELSVKTPESGEGIEEIDTSGITEPFTVGLNGNFILEHLLSSPSTQVTFALNGDQDLVTFTEPDSGAFYLCMPIRIS